MEQRYIATFILQAIGNTIGFKNAEWAYKYYSGESKKKVSLINMADESLYDFIALGGINQIDLKGWKMSNELLFDISVRYALYENINNTNTDSDSENDDNQEKLYKVIHTYLIKSLNYILKPDRKPLISDSMYNFKKYYIKKKEPVYLKDVPYDKTTNSSDATTRAISIGLIWYGKKNRDKLIDLAVKTSMITHNSPSGWMGAVVSALFTAMAIENKPITEWIIELMDIIDNDKLKKYIRKEYEEEELNDYEVFVANWKKFMDMRFDNKKNLIKSNATKHLLYRVNFHYENFSGESSQDKIFGYNGYSATIIAYDCLIDCDGKWETLIVYSSLHPGLGHMLGGLACAWYGAFYGMEHVPKNNYKDLEFKDDLTTLGTNYYNKYYKKNSSGVATEEKMSRLFFSNMKNIKKKTKK